MSVHQHTIFMHIVAIHNYTLLLYSHEATFFFPDLNQDSGNELEEANSENSGTASVETMIFYVVVGSVLS